MQTENFNVLAAFVVVAKELSFTRAAAKLGAAPGRAPHSPRASI